MRAWRIDKFLLTWLVGLLCSAGRIAFADTTHVGGGGVEGSWSASGSPYIVQGHLTVLAGDSLTIGAGTTVYFDGPYALNVFGYFAVSGAAGDSVVFTTDTLLNPAKWSGLYFNDAHDSSYVHYAVFEHAYSHGPTSADSLGGALYATGGTTMRVSHSLFRRNSVAVDGGAVYFNNSTLLMDSCLFTENYCSRDGAGLFLKSSTASVISRTVFAFNTSARHGGGAYQRGGTPRYVSCLFENNYAGLNGGGIGLQLSQARFDSCTVRLNVGNAHGGGFTLDQSNPEINDCLIEQNSTLQFDGAGMYLWESSPYVQRCRILNNVSADDGGGIHSYRAASNGMFEECEVRGNSAAGQGAGVWVTLDGAPTFAGCEIVGNEAGTHGGGVFLRNNAHPSFTQCRIDSNTAHGGGGGISIRQSQPTIAACLIRGNVAFESGGGVHLWEVAQASLSDCELAGNSCVQSGGGIAVNQSNLTAWNCLVVKNSAGLYGGLSAANSANVKLAQCTVAANGGIAAALESSVGDIQNCLFAGAGAVYFAAAQSSRITYSLLSGEVSWLDGNTAEGPAWIGQQVAVNANGDSCDTFFNVFTAPLFADSLNGDWSLSAASAAVGAGNVTTYATDLVGAARPWPIGTLPDLGALESSAGAPPAGLYGALSGSLGPGLFKVVADVRVDSNMTLTLQPGTTLQFCGPSGLLVEGNLQAVGEFSDSICFVTDTVMNPGRWRGICMKKNSSSSVMEFVKVSDAAALAGSRVEGGGLYLTGVSPTVTRSSLTRLSAWRGGGVYCFGAAAPVFEQCEFESCNADSGGIFCVRGGAAPTLNRCELRGGSAVAGGGWLSESSSGAIRNSRIEGNGATSAGAGVFLGSSQTIVENNLIVNNVCGDDGGGVWISGSSPQVKFNTIADNGALDGAGVYVRFGTAQIANNVIAENAGDGIYFYVAGSTSIRYNCVAANDSANFAFFNNLPSQGPVGIGALDSLNANGDPCDRYRNHVLSPAWVSGAEHDYYLAQTDAGDSVQSPSVNAADSAAAIPVGTTRTDFLSDIGLPDQGYHGLQLGSPPPAIDDLVIFADPESLRLSWSFEGAGLFYVVTDSSATGSFLTTVAVTTDTTVTLLYGPPLGTDKTFFKIIAESAQ